MEPRALGRTGLTISPIGLGCWQFSEGRGIAGQIWPGLTQATVDSVVAGALRGGITWGDTAQAYDDGASERALAVALEHAGVEPGGVTVAAKWLPILKPAWLITHSGEAVVAIPGASRPEQAAESAAAMDIKLTAAEVDRIDRLSAEIARR